MKKEKSCGTIIYNGNKVLIVKQKSGFYGFPKGHIENGETEIETAIRETKEETNIDVKVIQEYRYSISYNIKEDVVKESVFYLAIPLNLDFLPQETEISKIEWVDIDEVYDVLTFDNAKVMWLKAKKEVVGKVL